MGEGELVGKCTAVRRGDPAHYRGAAKPPPWVVDHTGTGAKVASCRTKKDCIQAAKGLEAAGGREFCTTDVKKLYSLGKKKPVLAEWGAFIWEHYIHYSHKRSLPPFQRWKKSGGYR